MTSYSGATSSMIASGLNVDYMWKCLCMCEKQKQRNEKLFENVFLCWLERASANTIQYVAVRTA